ncbi:MAG: hypothetical protein WBC91_19075 [Phototrophicaceae bacterium]
MTHLRQWELATDAPYTLHLASDARLSKTSYINDQSWDILLGSGDEAAIKLQTRYGSRTNLTSLVPMWQTDDRVIYQAQTYHNAPIITAFAPNRIIVNADILPSVQLVADHMAFSSQVVAGQYMIHNNTKKTLNLRLDLFGHSIANDEEQKLAIITMADKAGHALSLGKYARLAPVVLVENGNADSMATGNARPKVGVNVTIKAGASETIRFVHAGLDDLRQSLAEARRWLLVDWTAFISAIDTASDTIPTIQTGNLDWDLVIACSYNRAIQAVLRPNGIFPRETFVASRQPKYGFSRLGHGTDHPRMWQGQAVDSAYLLTPILAASYPQAAEGIIRNYVALQKKDGFIDLIPNLGGEHSGILCTPILARMAWRVYEVTQNRAFIEDNFNGLKEFFDHWLQQDVDEDGVPEWLDQRQTHYAAFPTFGMGREWSQGANISTVETPDLIAYLLSEADALIRMADIVKDKRAKSTLATAIKTLSEALESLWHDGHYAYRDRDTHLTSTGKIILDEGKGDTEHTLEEALLMPNRVIVKITGGSRHIPKVTLHIAGINTDGEPIRETANFAAFYWYTGEGVYTSKTTFSQINKIWCEGLSRVYSITARTLDTTQIDINTLVPLMNIIPDKNKQILADHALDDTTFLRPNGITMIPANNPHFDPANAEGAGGIWMYWQTLIGSGLIDAGKSSKVADIVKAQLDMLVTIFAETHDTAQFYHSDEVRAISEKGHLNGIAPLYLLQQLMGVIIPQHDRVHLSQEFGWGRAVSIRQHGVYVRRTTKSIKIEFASGHTIALDAPLKEAITVTDPKPINKPIVGEIALAEETKAVIPDPTPPPVAPIQADTDTSKRIIIEVDTD